MFVAQASQGSRSMSNRDVTLDGQLERIEGSLVRGRVGESSRLYRLHVGGHWYFCKAGDFDDIKQAESFLRHVQAPVRVTMAPYVVNGRRRVGWLHVHDSGKTLPPANPFRTVAVAMMVALIAVALCLAMYFGWSWVTQWPTAAFVVSVPVIIVLACITLFCLFGALTMMLEAVSRFRPSRVRAFFAYRRLHGGENA
jgi:hypothetical protein